MTTIHGLADSVQPATATATTMHPSYMVVSPNYHPASLYIPGLGTQDGQLIVR